MKLVRTEESQNSRKGMNVLETPGVFMLSKEAQIDLGEGRGRTNVTLETQKLPEKYQFTTFHQANKL